MTEHNNSKKDKMLLGKKNNLKIANRELEEAYLNKDEYKNRMNVDRIMLERQLTSHNFDNDSNDSNDSDENDTYVGEVTGDRFDESDVFAKGMPLRSSFTVKRSIYDTNSHLDFDLFDKIDKKHSNDISYNDTSSGDYAGIEDAMKTITRGVDPYETCVGDINSTTCWMHSNMFMMQQDDYIVNGFGLFMGHGILYLISRGNTEIELKNYFNFQDKKHLNAGLLTIREKTNLFRDQIIIDVYLINDKKIPSNLELANKLKSLIFNVVINLQYPDQEVERINNIIKTISGLNNIVSANTLLKSEISLITVAKLNPKWAYKVENTVNVRFKGKVINFIRFVGKTFDYFEDAERQLIEIPMYGDVFSIGMCLAKQNIDAPTDLKALSTSINYMKPTILDEVMFPMIKKRYKTRLNKTLQKTGLNVVFSEHELVGLFPETGSLNDCVQYVDLLFGTKSGNKRCDNKGYRTTRKFIANKSFEFYLRNTENNCIMMMGRL